MRIQVFHRLEENYENYANNMEWQVLITPEHHPNDLPCNAVKLLILVL